MAYWANHSPQETLARFLSSVSLDPGLAYDVRFTSGDPVVPSRFRLGTASAVALAAQAAAVREIWRLRGGSEQALAVDIAQAAYPGLCTFLHIRQNGHLLPFLRDRAGLGGPGGNFFETRDGRRFYLFHNANYIDHCLRVHRFLGATTSTQSLREKVAAWDADALEEALAQEQLIGAYARTADEWAAHPQGAWLLDQQPANVHKAHAGAPEGFAPARRPLEGVRVVDMGHVLAGPLTSRVLAEQGAQVIHISAPHQSDGALIELDTGFGKRAAYIDLRVAADRLQLMTLIKSADVFIQSWRTGTLERHGLSAQALWELRPGLVYAALSCYGHEGGWATRGGYEPMGQTVSGLAIAEGSPEQPRLAATFTLNDYLTAYLTAAGVAAALLRRAREGGSYEVRTSLTRTSMWVQQLGQLPATAWPHAPQGVRDMPDVAPAWLQETPSPFGVLTHPRPIVNYSVTPGHWALPPMPAGSAPAQWEDTV